MSGQENVRASECELNRNGNGDHNTAGKHVSADLRSKLGEFGRYRRT